MASYPPGGDYDARLLQAAPEATKSEKQEGYNVNLLASDSSDAPMNPRTQATVDEQNNLEAGTTTPPDKEAFSSHSGPWHRQSKWRVVLLIAGIIIIGAVVGGVVGGTVSHNNKNSNIKSNSNGSPQTLSLAPDSSPLAPSASGSSPPPSSGIAPTPTTSTRPAPSGSGVSIPTVVDMGIDPGATVALVG